MDIFGHSPLPFFSCTPLSAQTFLHLVSAHPTLSHLISRNLISSRFISLHPRNKNSPRLSLSHHIKSHLAPSFPFLSYSLSSLVVCTSLYSHTIVSCLFILYLCLSYTVPVSSGFTVVPVHPAKKASLLSWPTAATLSAKTKSALRSSYPHSSRDSQHAHKHSKAFCIPQL